MKSLIAVVVICMGLLVFVATGTAEETPTIGQTVTAIYPNLASGVLTFAELADLPKGILLRAGEVEMSEIDVSKSIEKQPKQFQEQLRKNAFFVLEKEATRKLLVEAARKSLNETGEQTPPKSEQELINKYIARVTERITVTEDDISRFYEENEASFCGTPLEKVKDRIGPYVLGEKKQRAIDEHLRTLGQRISILVSASWTKEQAVLARDNPLNKARDNGKPTLVIFSAASCCGPDKMLPVLKSLQEKYADKINILYLEARKEQILAARYAVHSIPTQILYDKGGKEVFRHSGFLPQTDVEKKLKDVGIM
ncbi:MAG TPA: thioredoxin family protein [Sedimentisphaerales bacterium]|nr:thioredoxin family protein [Sedimentisphaerales bacterium]